jgi:DNA-binding transcriptional LysR family regulator
LTDILQKVRTIKKGALVELNYLRVFYEVARAGKFSESAKKLRISQSALSRSVSLLEENEGVTLFDRSKSGVSLTAKGQEVFRLCDELFKKEKEIENLCRGVQEKCEGYMRFASSDHLINDFLPEPLLNFKKKYPNIVPSIRTGTPEEITDFLINDECEFALLFAKVNSPQIEFKNLRSEKMSLVCHPALWKECGSLRKLIAKYGYISSIDANLNRRSSQVMLELFGEIPSIGFEVNSQESQKRFCLAGEGAAYLAHFMVKKEIEKGLLFEIPIESAHEFPLWLATAKGKQLSLASRTFLKLFFES